MPQRNGRSEALSPEQRGLAGEAAWLKKGRYVARLYTRKFPRLADEFESAANLAIVSAARTFDPDRGVRFSSHLFRRLKGAMLDVMREAELPGYRRKRTVPAKPGILSAETPITADPSDPCPPRRLLTLGDMIVADEGEVGWEEDGLDGLTELTKGLTSREREVVHRLYGRADCSTMKRTGRSLGLSESRVSQLHSEAMDTLRRRFGVAP